MLAARTTAEIRKPRGALLQPAGAEGAHSRQGEVGGAASTREREPSIAAAQRNRGAFGPLYRRHYAAIAGYLLRRTGDAHCAEDLAAETFLAALGGLRRFRGTDEAAFRRWLFAIATNAANRWARRRARLRLVSIEDRGPGATPAGAGHEGPMTAAAEREEAQAAMLALHPDQQAVLSLHYLEGLPIEEVASVIRCPVGTVKSRLSRARRALSQELERRSHRHA